jgi:sugar/nucleoside kinase (ribokinase family)
MPKRVLVVGDVIDDVIVVPHGPIRPDTDTISDIRSTPGGSAGNTASWLGHLGVEVEFVGMVAQADVARHSAEFARYGVTPRLQGHPTLPTGAIVILVEGDTRAMLTERGANDSIDLDAIDVTGFAALHLTGYSLFKRADAAPVIALIQRARDAGLQVCVDPGSAGFLVDYGVQRFLEGIAGATILVPNLEEARVLTGILDPAAAAAALDFPVVAVTMDREGVIANGTFVGAVTTSIVDPTGAGDAFTAGFLAGLLQGEDPATASRGGARLAATAVARVGARPQP